MIQVYFTENSHKWSSDKLAEILQPLPDEMRNKISAYKNWQERQSRILGKSLLLKMIEHYKLDLSLADLRYTEYNKPFFDHHFDFSISHALDIVICGGSMNANIGVDIEQIAPAELPDYQEHLTKNEWGYIHRSADPQIAFYKIWTKKEALLKALGRGVDIDLDTLDVSSDTVTTDGRQYWFYALPVAEGYIAHIATSAPFDSGPISSEMLSDLLSAHP